MSACLANFIFRVTSKGDFKIIGWYIKSTSLISKYFKLSVLTLIFIGLAVSKLTIKCPSSKIIVSMLAITEGVYSWFPIFEQTGKPCKDTRYNLLAKSSTGRKFRITKWRFAEDMQFQHIP